MPLCASTIATMSNREKHCVPCEDGSGLLERPQAEAALKKLSGWKFSDKETAIEKDYKFKDFREALGFTNEVGDVAEFEGHHPDIFIHNWNRVTITLSTHAAKGLTENDFIMAGLIDRAFKEAGQ